MKRIILITTLVSILVFAHAQVQPQWTQTINTLPDSAYLLPVKVLTDANSDVIVLCTYSPSTGVDNKIVLHKYDGFGSLIWTYTFNNSSTGSPRGFDMVLDSAGNIYVAGGFMDAPYDPLLMKVRSSGTVDWLVNGVSAQINSNFNQLFLVHNRLYAGASDGIAVLDLNGNEDWSVNTSVNRMAVDHYGQTIISSYSGGANLFRYDINGNVNLSDTTIDARRICIDNHNNILLLSDISSYVLVKYDSAGTFAWQKDSLPMAPPFGDIGFEVLTDLYDDVILVGINDSIYKFSSSGSLKWIRSMNGLDSYRISAKMIGNLLLIAGSIDNGGQRDVGVGLFNLYGIQNWSGAYNSNNFQEFSVDVEMDGAGVYVLEDSSSSTSLLRFEVPFFSVPVNYSLVCVDSVWYDTVNPGMINVNVFNGDIAHMNYPSVMIISPSGDTISNRNNDVNFFAHIGNTSQVYTDSINILGITDFTGYTFVISEGFGSSSAIIHSCATLSVEDIFENPIRVFPNPFTDRITIDIENDSRLSVSLIDQFGRHIFSRNISEGEKTIDVSGLAPGMYFLQVEGQSWKIKLLKMQD